MNTNGYAAAEEQRLRGDLWLNLVKERNDVAAGRAVDLSIRGGRQAPCVRVTKQQVVHYMQPMAAGSEELAIDAIKEVGPNGNFFSAGHTLERYETAFCQPFLSDLNNFESWEEAGGVRTPQRANKMWKQILKEFEAPPMDLAIHEELEAFVERRKEEGGAPTDF